MSIALAAFAFGVLVGLLIGPDSERERSAHVDGWLHGYHFGRRQIAKKDRQP